MPPTSDGTTRRSKGVQQQRVQQQRVNSLPKKRQAPTTLPQRGIWAIDELKRVSKLEELHVVGIDPGNRCGD